MKYTVNKNARHIPEYARKRFPTPIVTIRVGKSLMTMLRIMGSVAMTKVGPMLLPAAGISSPGAKKITVEYLKYHSLKVFGLL